MDYIDGVVTGDGGENHKSQLQHYIQREFGRTPTYTLIDQKGPDHSKSFKVAAQVGKRLFEPAWGRSKKEAEQSAAKKAIEFLAEGKITEEEIES